MKYTNKLTETICEKVNITIFKEVVNEKNLQKFHCQRRLLRFKKT